MKPIGIHLTVLFFAWIPCSLLAQQETQTKPNEQNKVQAQPGTEKKISSDEKQIRQTIQNYFKGYNDGNVELLKEAFDKNCQIKYLDLRSKKYSVLTMEKLHDFMNNLPKGWKSVPKIFSIQHTSNTAMAKVSVTVMNGRLTWTDYLSLLKIDGKWKIYSKISHGDFQRPGQKKKETDVKDEKAAIKKAIANYIDGHNKPDAELVKKAFHSGCIIKYSNPFQGGKYSEIPQPKFLKMIENLPSDWKATGESSMIDFHKTAASAKVVLKTNEGKLVWTDYLGLLKIDGQWNIVTKVAEGIRK